jgi:hypothetical protein
MYSVVQNWKTKINVPFAADATTGDISLGGAGRFALIIPAPMNTLTATFQVFNPVTDSWISSGVTQVLATGLFTPSEAQLAPLRCFDKIRVSLSAAPGTACMLQAFMSF